MRPDERVPEPLERRNDALQTWIIRRLEQVVLLPGILGPVEKLAVAGVVMDQLVADVTDGPAGRRPETVRKGPSV